MKSFPMIAAGVQEPGENPFAIKRSTMAKELNTVREYPLRVTMRIVLLLPLASFASPHSHVGLALRIAASGPFTVFSIRSTSHVCTRGDCKIDPNTFISRTIASNGEEIGVKTVMFGMPVV